MPQWSRCRHVAVLLDESRRVIQQWQSKLQNDFPNSTAAAAAPRWSPPPSGIYNFSTTRQAAFFLVQKKLSPPAMRIHLRKQKHGRQGECEVQNLCSQLRACYSHLLLLHYKGGIDHAHENNRQTGSWVGLHKWVPATIATSVVGNPSNRERRYLLLHWWEGMRTTTTGPGFGYTSCTF